MLNNTSATRSLRLYDNYGRPVPNFNALIKGWLEKTLTIREHKPPASFDLMWKAYNVTHEALTQTLDQNNRPRWEAHKLMLSDLTKLMFGIDIKTDLATRLSSENINEKGLRTALQQGYLKNTGENFINIIAYTLADALSFQDEVLIDKNLPPYLRDVLTLKRTFKGSISGVRKLETTIEGDLTIFSRSNPKRAIVVSAKTRLKEVFHIGTMWALFFDMLSDEYILKRWGLERVSSIPLEDIMYIFATADLIPEKGKNTQGPDIKPGEVRNLIGMDASFFNYVFVSKQGIDHVSRSLEISRGREALFHELGCLLDLIEQKFDLSTSSSSSFDTLSTNLPKASEHMQPTLLKFSEQ